MAKKNRKKAKGGSPSLFLLRAGWPLAKVVGLGVLSLVSLLYLRDYLDTNRPFQLRQIHFQGLVHLDQSNLEKLIRATFSEASLVSIDLDRVRRLVESETWVKSALIRRKFPEHIYIHIDERVPMAAATIDSELFVVDEEGIVLEQYDSQFPVLDKPMVKGLKNPDRENAFEENRERMETYLTLVGALSDGHPKHTDGISEVDVSDTQNIGIVHNDDPVPVYLGKGSYRERYELFLDQKDFLSEVRREGGKIESVDLSYEDQIVLHRELEPIAEP